MASISVAPIEQVARSSFFIEISVTYLENVRNKFFIIFLTINPNPPCQLSLWEETGEPGENPRLSAEY